MKVLKASIITVAIATSFYLVLLVSHDGNLLLKTFLPEDVGVVESTDLTTKGILEIGNRERSLLGLDPLLKDERLSLAAEMKIDDMFERQYFDHVSPSGEEAGDLVALTGYRFIAVGENLASGNFNNDGDLIAGWMDSPGHRENIVNPGYMEIGIAVRKGNFEEQEIWLAVQIFALPDHVCPKPDRNLLSAISANEKRLSEIRKELELLRIEIESTVPRNREAILEYNASVHEYNALSDETQAMVRDYNSQVRETNDCIASYGF